MRSSGILLHPTSLPGPHGIGELGKEAFAFVEWLAAAGQALWQVLPLGPTGYGDSPYQSFSSFAGNPLLISLDTLVSEGYLNRDDLAGAPASDPGRVDYGALIPWKQGLLARASQRFGAGRSAGTRAQFETFCRTNAAWLDDYALFAALKEAHGGAAWNMWQAPLALRQPGALARARTQHAPAIERVRFAQWQFFRQWDAVRARARAHGIRLIGDVPIFVAYDSADVWQNPHLFRLDASGNPEAVAGVPPDYFSESGQLWGNPLYRWEAHARDGYAWWIERIRAALAQVDTVRIDHFRGFEAYWEVPAGDETAANGRWMPGPGGALFDALKAALGDLPIIAEDLGVITPAVRALRDAYGLPGMKVLQFAFHSDAADPFLPHNYPRHCVVYTGTHDNDTTAGWFAAAGADERRKVLDYLDTSGSEIARDFIRLAMASVADTCIVPLQDVLGLGSEARMNYPSKTGGWWTWRVSPGGLTAEVATGLRKMAQIYGRVPGKSTSATQSFPQQPASIN